MESKPSRIPRRISVQPPSSLSARMMSGSRGSSLNDTCHSRDPSFRLDSEYQSTSASASASPFQSTWYSESEITQGARSRSQNQQRDHDSKRPKLSCTNCTSTSAGRNVGHGLNTVSDSSWRHSQVPRSSSVVLGSFGSDLMRERRDLERRADSSFSNLMDYSHRSGDFTTSSYVQDRVPSSYSQGARPKENSVSTLQLTTSSTNHQMPSERQTIPCSRDSSRNSLRSNFSPRELESPQSSTQPGFSYISNRGETSTISNSDRVGSSQRSFQESSDNEGRRTTRRLLSRIASSWSSSDGKSDKTKSAPSRDPERLQKIKESLLLEDSEEEDGDLCRICQMAAASSSNLLIEPCKCTGSLQYVHQECMKKWLQAKINSGSSLEAVTTCELCKEKLQLNLEDFDIHELHRAHANEQAEYEFISSGLYLVVLLHLCEQSFSDMMGNTSEPSTRVRFINLARTLQAHMEDLETSEDDSEEDGDHNRTFDIA
uniref:E3 ubiquitin-protein ligase MARCHF7 n=1 Tax=Molossus molossus TaxID=27622 RepID=A0A7J8FT12_MOLMO|nr:hypothetical protein HJG59_011933 [Molossus molossus]